MKNKTSEMNRRKFLGKTAGAVLASSAGVSLVMPTHAGAKAKVVIKYDWLMSNGQVGDVVAAKKGYFEDAGLEVEFSPGGPNSATASPVVSGAATLGQFSETPQLFNARASGVPVKVIACGFRTGPYVFTSKTSKPLRSVDDLRNVRIGIQPTARFIIEAIAAKNNIPMSELTVVSVGSDYTPLIRGDVDAVGGWITNTQALSVIEDRVDLMVSDMGLPSYADVYFATDDAVENNADILAKFIGAVAKGWGYVHANPKESVKILVNSYDGISEKWEMKTIDLILKLSFDDDTKRDGWGTFDPQVLEEQLSLFDSIGQYKNGRPSLADVHTTRILEMTKNDRPKLGYNG